MSLLVVKIGPLLLAAVVAQLACRQKSSRLAFAHLCYCKMLVAFDRAISQRLVDMASQIETGRSERSLNCCCGHARLIRVI